MDVSIIIVNYNTINIIIDAIDSVFEKTEGVDYEIIIVDNNSSDNSETILFEKYDTKIKYIGLSENLGFGKANNKGIEIAKGRNILFLNPDTKLINNSVKILSDYLDLYPYVGACGGNLFDEDMNPTHSFRRFFPSVFSEFNELLCNIPANFFYTKNTDFNHTNNPLNVAYITGADLMIKKAIIEQIGTFDPVFFMYYEETELCWRIRKAGYEIMSIPEAKIQHLEGKSFKNEEINSVKLKFVEDGKYLFYSLCYSLRYVKYAYFFIKIFISIKINVFRMLNKEKYKYWTIRKELINNLLNKKYA